jgi:peptidyl-prolyl cis-trans isomerase SurA
MNERINELLILQAAGRDTTIQIKQDQIEQQVQRDINQRQQQAGGAVQFESALRAAGLTPSEFRERLIQQQRKSAMIQQYLARLRQRRKAPPISEQELRAHFETVRDRLPERPPTICFQQVHVMTLPSDSAVTQARVRADSVYQMAVANGDFAELARRYSQDPGSREDGGNLGFFRRGNMIPAFEDSAFRMAPGSISPPIRTLHGFHIIKVERIRGPEIQARHILISPDLTSTDALAARARADTVAERLRAGGDAVELARQYGNRDEQVRVLSVEATLIQERYGIDMSAVSIGDVLGPIPTGGDEVAERFVVLKILEKDPARTWTLDDAQLREQLRQDLEFQKLFEEIVEELRRSTYVDIRGT